MKKFKSISILLVFIFSAALFSNSNQLKAKEIEGEWNYKKKVWFSFDPEKLCIYYNEECTIDAGNQCAQPNGAFRTCVSIIHL